MKNIACFILSYEITKGMKSYGPLGLLKSNQASSRELILCQIDSLNKIFDRPNISIISGFGADKLYKKVPSNVHKVHNDKFEGTNHGYAIKLMLSNLDMTKYDGLFLLQHGVLIKELNFDPSFDLFKKSWVLTRQIKKQDHKGKFMGSVVQSNGLLDYIFYDTGSFAWCNSVYFTNQDLIKIKKSINSYYDNMFLFEIINKSISLDLIEYQNVVVPHESIIMIEGIKDKHKIKTLS